MWSEGCAGQAAKLVLRLVMPNTGKGNAPHLSLAVLAIGQLVSWGTLYYGITFVAEPVQRETGWSLGWIFAAFSAGLFLAAMATPFVGRLIFRRGGRIVMSAGSFLAAIAFSIIASSHDFLSFLAGWLLAGIAMSMTLYEAAFSMLREIPALNFRRSVGIVTIVGGFASTLFWPLTHWLAGEFGWRATLLVYAGLNLLICFLLYLALGTRPIFAAETGRKAEFVVHAGDRSIVLLAISFGLVSLATAAISSHAGLLMASKHVPDWLAMTALVLIGPMQVAGRIAELSVAHRMSAVSIGMAAMVAMAASLLFLQFAGYCPWLAFGFVLAYGASNGVMAVVRGTIVAESFDKHDYAVVLGMLSAPAMLARALGPVLAALSIDIFGMGTLVWMLVLLLIAGLVCYWRASGFMRVGTLSGMACPHFDGHPVKLTEPASLSQSD